LSTPGIEAVQARCESFYQVIAASGAKLPINTGGHDLLLRKLDYGVINHVHASLMQGALQAFDTLGSTFIEEEPPIGNFRFLPQDSRIFHMSQSESIGSQKRPPSVATVRRDSSIVAN
jgi:hypothetical protein